MSNFTLATVEGGGNFLPLGSVVSLVDEYPDVFEQDGIVYSKDDVPGRVIPNFDTKVPAAIKGYVKETLYGIGTNRTEGNFAASGISSSGVMIRVFNTTGNISNGISIQRRVPNGTYETVLSGAFIKNTTAAHHALVRTNNAGVWVISMYGTLFISKDDGYTWAIKHLVDALESIIEIKFGATGTLLMSARRSTGTTTKFLFRSTDNGDNWHSINLSNVNCIVNTVGSTWYAFVGGSTTIQKSTDDGVTWVTDGTLGFTPAADGVVIPSFYSNGRFYFLNVNTVHTATTLTSTSALSGTYYGLGVDNLGNAIAVDANSQVFKSSNGGGFSSTNSRAGYVTGTYASYIEFANGTYVDKTGAFITAAALDLGKGWVNYMFAGNGKSADRGPNNVVLIGLNTSTYLRSTDNGKTFTVRTFDVPFNTALGVSFVLSGLATDGFGNWAAHVFGTTIVYYSTDDGLTWTVKNISSFAGISNLNKGIAGGGASGTFFIINVNGDAWLTTNGFNTATNYVLSASFGTRHHNPVYSNGFFYWITSPSVSSYVLQAVNAITSVRTSVTLSSDLGLTGPNPLLNYGNTLGIGGFLITAGGAGTNVIEGRFGNTVNNLIDGIPNNSTKGIHAGITIDKVGEVLVPRGLTATSYLYVEGILDLSLPANSFIKVA